MPASILELVAIGSNRVRRWRKPVDEGQLVRIGRAPRNGWAIEWDPKISREHAELEFDGDRLHVRQLPTAKNPVFLRNAPCGEFTVNVGESFRIGETTFRLVDTQAQELDRRHSHEFSFAAGTLMGANFGDAEHRLKLLSQLPTMIAQSRNAADFATMVVKLLLRAIPKAEAAALVHYSESADPKRDEPMILRWDSRMDDGQFKPSRRLIGHVLERGESTLYLWTEEETAGDLGEMTQAPGMDWAFCTPITDRASKGWCLYLSGRSRTHSGMSTQEDLKSDMRFTELLAQFIGAIRQVRRLEQQQSQMSQYFSPAVVEALMQDDAESLVEPRLGEISVLFCDLRGFSRNAEQSRDNLIELLHRVGEALGVMTDQIMRYEGVIADFQGDSALAFWGWPTQLEDGPLPACRAALSMQAEFRRANREPGHILSGFQVGIGIGHGQAVAGKIGPETQCKVGIFGTVVNLTSRLEGMTKLLGASVLLDEVTADFVRRELPAAEAVVRRVGRYQPVGLVTPIAVSQLLSPEIADEWLTAQQLADFEAIVDCFSDGRWLEALSLMDGMPPEDGPTAFLKSFMERNEYEPPPEWEGTIPLTQK